MTATAIQCRPRWMPEGDTALVVTPENGTPKTLKPGVYPCRDGCGNDFLRVVDTDAIPTYDVVQPTLLFDKQDRTLSERIAGRRAFVVIDPQVNRRYGERIQEYLANYGISYDAFVLPQQANNEQNKSVNVWSDLHNAFVNSELAARDVILGIGGGVVSDLVGFGASTYRRGVVPYLLVTTTLTATIDAGISPKTAINVFGHKNSCGTTYPPEAVMTDIRLLDTDPAIKTGLAEMIKLAVIRELSLFEQLEHDGKQLVDSRFQTPDGRTAIKLAQRRFLSMKFELPFPGNRPASLRAFGHAFSRRIEDRSWFLLTHGEAIAAEMAVAANLAAELGGLAAGERDRIIDLLDRFELIPWCPECNEEDVWPVFAGRFERKMPFWFPIPQQIGSGTFLKGFTKDSLGRAIAGVPQLRVKKSLSGRVQYFAAERGALLRVTADFAANRPVQLYEEDPWAVRAHRWNGFSDAEQIFAYRLLTIGQFQEATLYFDRDREAVMRFPNRMKIQLVQE